MTLGDKISKLRKENNYTQEQLADMLGVSRQSISKWESDITYPETDKLIRMSKLFDCTTDYLLLEEEDSPKRTERMERDVWYPFRWKLHEKKSEKTVFGMPLWHIGKNAKGVVAVGMNARGIIAISLGVISLGAIAIGDFSVGALAIGKYFAIGDNARAMIAIGDTKAAGSVFMKLGTLTTPEISVVKELLDANVPHYLHWITEIVKWFL